MPEVVSLTEELMSAAFFWPKDKITEQLSAIACHTYIAEAEPGQMPDGQRLLAFICFVDLGAAVEIPVLATHPKVQNQGIMQALFYQAIAMHYAGRELWLEVHEENHIARNLYRTLGFVESGKRPGYYNDGSAAILCNREISES